MKMNRVTGRHRRRLFLSLLMLFAAVSPLFAQRKITIKLASLVPENTAWGAAINRMAADWARITNGEVEMIVYHNGVAGDEPVVLQKLRLNQIQAAVFTSIGLNSVMPEALSISYPFLIRNNAELDEVMRVIKPELDATIQRNGFVTLAWAQAGWIRIFSRMPVVSPNDLRRIKLSTGGDIPQMVQAFRVMEYQMVQAELSQLMISLNSGMVDATYISPIYAAGNQIFGPAKNMLGINIAPFMGGILMNDTAWRRIPDRYKPQLLESSKRIEREIESSISSLESEAIATMVRYGLSINELSPQQAQEWYADTAKYENILTSSGAPIFNREYYQKISAILANYRGRR